MGIVSLIKNKQISLAVWTLLSAIGYIAIMGLTYGQFDKNILLLHVESEWVCFGIIAATPFVFSFLPGSKPVFSQWLLAGVFIARFTYISLTIPPFVARVQMIKHIQEQMKKKGITKLAL